MIIEKHQFICLYDNYTFVLDKKRMTILVCYIFINKTDFFLATIQQLLNCCANQYLELHYTHNHHTTYTLYTWYRTVCATNRKNVVQFLIIHIYINISIT